MEEDACQDSVSRSSVGVLPLPAHMHVAAVAHKSAGAGDEGRDLKRAEEMETLGDEEGQGRVAQKRQKVRGKRSASMKIDDMDLIRWEHLSPAVHKVHR